MSRYFFTALNARSRTIFTAQNSDYQILILVIIVDIVFITLSSVHHLNVFNSVSNNYLFDIEADMSYSEVYQYIKEFWIVLILGWLSYKKNSYTFLNWAILFMIILLDDALSIHEIVGENFALDFGIEYIPDYIFGELIYFIILFSLFIISALISYFRDQIYEKRISESLIILLGLLAFFGVIVDTFRSIVMDSNIGWIFGLIEDGGELIMMSILFWFLYKTNRKIIANI